MAELETRLSRRTQDDPALHGGGESPHGLVQRPAHDNDAGPFGGFKQSGLSRELGRDGLEAFQETKHVHIESEVAPKEWWYPYSRYTGGEPPHGA